MEIIGIFIVLGVGFFAYMAGKQNGDILVDSDVRLRYQKEVEFISQSLVRTPHEFYIQGKDYDQIDRFVTKRLSKCWYCNYPTPYTGPKGMPSVSTQKGPLVIVHAVDLIWLDYLAQAFVSISGAEQFESFDDSVDTCYDSFLAKNMDLPEHQIRAIKEFFADRENVPY